MSEHDLPDRLAKYGGDHVDLERIALTRKQTDGLPSFPASDKRKDPVTSGFRNFGAAVGNWMRWTPTISAPRRGSNQDEIEPVAWERCETVNRAEQDSLQTILDKWRNPRDRAHHPISSANAAPIFISEAAEGGGLVLARDHGWFHGDRRLALVDAQWLAWDRASGAGGVMTGAELVGSCPMWPGISGASRTAATRPRRNCAGDQRRPQCRCRQGRMVRPRGRGRRRGPRFP